VNKELSGLRKVITLMQQGNTEDYIFRENNLTKFMKDSLNGDSKTLMIVNISPSVDSVRESINSLRFGAELSSLNSGHRKSEEPEKETQFKRK
jgi:hypothetical protein